MLPVLQAKKLSLNCPLTWLTPSKPRFNPDIWLVCFLQSSLSFQFVKPHHFLYLFLKPCKNTRPAIQNTLVFSWQSQSRSNCTLGFLGNVSNCCSYISSGHYSSVSESPQVSVPAPCESVSTVSNRNTRSSLQTPSSAEGCWGYKANLFLGHFP